MSELSRWALDRNEFPLFSADLFMLALGTMMYSIADKMADMLVATDFEPYGLMLQPYVSWARSGAVYLRGGDSQFGKGERSHPFIMRT